MRRNSADRRGKVETLWIDSAALQGNALGDPTRRQVDVYVPAGHSGAELPLLVCLTGFLSGGPAQSNWKNFGENLPERLDRLIAAGELEPVVVALPDCFTSLGGNQYINSAAIGNWADFLLHDLVPFVEQHFGCGGDRRRGVFGKSSGGYGAMTHALLYPDFWAAAACHSGDMAFELVFLPEFPQVLRALSGCDMNVEAWLKAFYARPKQKGSDLHVLLILAMCASFDPDPEAPFGIRLPVDPHTAEVIPERWHNFMCWDPINLAAKRADGLKQLSGLYLDCGTEDQYNLLYGARRLHALLQQQRIDHVYEEFRDDHSGIDYRLDKSLPFLVRTLSG